MGNEPKFSDTVNVKVQPSTFMPTNGWNVQTVPATWAYEYKPSFDKYIKWDPVVYDDYHSVPVVTYSPAICTICSLKPGACAFIAERKEDPYVAVYYASYLGLAEILKCKHPSLSVKVQILNGGPCHGLVVDILRKYVTLL